MADHPATVEDLAYTIHNPSGTTTVVLLHALFSSTLEYEHVPSHLPPTYRILIPHLPQHSSSIDHRPFSFDLATTLLARLITTLSPQEPVHLSGVDLGGFIALSLVRRHPVLVSSVLITGCYPYTAWQRTLASYPSLMSWGLYLTIQSGLYRAAAATANVPRHRPLIQELLTNNTYDLAARGYEAMRTWDAEETRDAALKDKRILVCASGTGDDVDATKAFAETLAGLGNGDGKETRAVILRDGIHGWNLQLPRLFAETLDAWIQKKALPERLEAL
ncbi:alpha/beta hydrolase family protein [Sarocladium implicatum]|nr:alpha/beta hydrolase family protein [Sarocladium implicatum]